MLKDKVECGFNKWSIGIGENYEVVVEFNRQPNFGIINLHDATSEDFRNLGEMFLAMARDASK